MTARTPWPNAATEGKVAGLMTRAAVSREGSAGWPKRMVLSLASASFAGTAAAVIDALFARASLEGDRSPGILTLARFDLGLIAPLALCLGLAAGAAAIVIEPERLRSPKELWNALAGPARSRWGYFAAGLGSVAVGVAGLATAVVKLALVSLASE